MLGTVQTLHCIQFASQIADSINRHNKWLAEEVLRLLYQLTAIF